MFIIAFIRSINSCGLSASAFIRSINSCGLSARRTTIIPIGQDQITNKYYQNTDKTAKAFTIGIGLSGNEAVAMLDPTEENVKACNNNNSQQKALYNLITNNGKVTIASNETLLIIIGLSFSSLLIFPFLSNARLFLFDRNNVSLYHCPYDL